MTRSRTDKETAAMNRYRYVEERSRGPDTDAEMDRQVKAAQATLLAQHAPDTRVRRALWSQDETQVLELRDGPPLLLVHGGRDGAFEWVPILR
jgi:hypothetical protein